MEENVVNFPGLTTVELMPDKVLLGGIQADLGTVVVLGWTRDGNLYLASSVSDLPEIVYLLEGAKKFLLEQGFSNA